MCWTLSLNQGHPCPSSPQRDLTQAGYSCRYTHYQHRPKVYTTTTSLSRKDTDSWNQFYRGTKCHARCQMICFNVCLNEQKLLICWGIFHHITLQARWFRKGCYMGGVCCDFACGCMPSSGQVYPTQWIQPLAWKSKRFAFRKLILSLCSVNTHCWTLPLFRVNWG